MYMVKRLFHRVLKVPSMTMPTSMKVLSKYLRLGAVVMKNTEGSYDEYLRLYFLGERFACLGYRCLHFESR